MKFSKNRLSLIFHSIVIISILMIVPLSFAKIISIYGIHQTDAQLEFNKTITSGVSLFVNDTLVYIIEDYHGLDIFNVSNKNKPEIVGFFDFTWGFHPDYSNLIVQDDYIFFYSQDTNTITILDCSNLADITIKENYTLSGNRLNNFAVDGWNIFAISDNNFTIYDFTNFLPLSPIGSYFNTSSNFVDLVLQENHSYLLEEEKGITILNITDYSNIVKIGEVIINESSHFPAFDVTDEYIFIYEEYKGLSIFDIMNPLNPIFITKYDYSSYYFGGLCIENNFVYLANSSSFDIIDISLLPTTQLIGQYNTEYSTFFEAIVVDNNFAYLLSTQSGELQGRRPLYIVDVTNPELPIHLFPGDPFPFFSNIGKILLITLGVTLAGSAIIISVILVVYSKRTKEKYQNQIEMK